eukprot:scaffold298934_cov76-Cyclotella_meneghiniana.AAC.1
MLFKSTLVAMLACTSSASILESDLAQSAVKDASTAFVEGIQLRGAASAIHFNMLEMDVNQKVSIVGVEVSGSGCASFDKAAVADPSRPVIEWGLATENLVTIHVSRVTVCPSTDGLEWIEKAESYKIKLC